jgi:hypothetical protein
VVHDDDLVVATFGRSFWVLDDVTPLRQMDTHVAAADSWLFRPETAYRVRPGSDQGTPVPTDEALAENPLTGAAIDYYLKAKAPSAVQLEIFDSEGKLVRKFASDDELRKTNPDNVPFEVKWVPEPQALSAEAGMHRFVWDLHYALPKGVRGSFWGPSGALAVPGSYTVKLTAFGKSRTQPLTIRMDPRVKTSQEVLVRQFELASKITTKLGEASTSSQEVGALRKQLDARKKEAAGKPELEQALADVEKKLDEAVEPDSDAEFMLFGLAVPGKEHEPLPNVASALTSLLIIVESADAGPTADAALASEKWVEAAGETLARWTSFRKEDLTNINVLLQKANLKPLSISETPAH